MSQAISPNWHVILIHYPLGLLSVGLIVEILSFLWRRSSVRTAARWMILIGALSCVPALTSGIYAYRDAAAVYNAQGQRIDDGMHWHEITRQSVLNAHDGAPWAFLRRHILFNAIGSGILAVLAVLWLGSSDWWRRRLYALHLLLLLAGFGLLTCGAWNGGETIYRYGTAVRPDHSAMASPDAAADSDSAGNSFDSLNERAQYYVPPIQLHVLLAGIVIAIGIAALGLSIRAIVDSGPASDMFETTEPRVPGAAVPSAPAIPYRQPGTTLAQDQEAIFLRGNDPRPAPEVRRTPEPEDLESALRGTSEPAAGVPSARWWLLATLVAIATLAAGLWLEGWTSWKTVQGNIIPPTAHARFFVHTIGGSSIIVLTLLLAIAARWMRRSRVTFIVLALLLILAIASQIWGGILLMLDTPAGPLKSFAPVAVLKTVLAGIA